ncbi:MAG: helix-turn-helix transcriptional regulator [Bacteroidales bacterium]|jgi:transcriptional regulator with XRE-family HTH domain
MEITDDFLKNIGKKLKETRLEKRYSLKEVAYTIGVTPTHYSSIEACKVIPRIKVLLKAVQFLEISLDNMIFGYPENDVKDVPIFERLKVINELKGEDRTIALQLLDLIIAKKTLKEIVGNYKPVPPEFLKKK